MSGNTLGDASHVSASVLPFTYLIYLLYPSVYPIKGPAVSDVVHQEDSLVEDKQKQSGSFTVGKVKGAGHPQKSPMCKNQEAKGQNVAPAAPFVCRQGKN